MIIPNPEKVLIAIQIGKHNIMAVSEKPQPDIRADAFQHKVCLIQNLKTKQYGFCGRTGEQQDTEDEKRSVPFVDEKDKSDKKAAGPDQKSQDQPPE